jgi:hypothetical protein
MLLIRSIRILLVEAVRIHVACGTPSFSLAGMASFPHFFVPTPTTICGHNKYGRSKYIRGFLQKKRAKDTHINAAQKPT